METKRVFEARIAEAIHAEAKRLGVNPHTLVDGIRAYVVLPPTPRDLCDDNGERDD
jgi:hypothetical protein